MKELTRISDKRIDEIRNESPSMNNNICKMDNGYMLETINCAIGAQLAQDKRDVEDIKKEVAREILEEIDRERFAEPQHIPEAGRNPIIICLTEEFMQSLKEKYQ